MLNVFIVIACISGIVLIIAVMMQDSKSAGFSAAMGGSDNTAQFSKDSTQELYDTITKISAIVWILSTTVVAIIQFA
ncbi:MAG: preprotein translocase subunit SecG [Armatimonadota bacterium]